jgi:FkbM family methyltransferase
MQIHGTSALRFIASRSLWAMRLSSLFTIQASSYKLRFYPSSVSMAMWCNPHFFHREESLLQEVLRPGDVFVDVGANIGALSLAASNIVGKSGHVFAVEAHPKTVEYLRGNVRLNRTENVSIIHAAAGDREGIVHFTSRRSDDQNYISSSGIEVPIRTLDSLLPDVPIRLLKIDVEGFELFVLRGAEHSLQKTEMIYFESWESHFRKFGYSTSDVLRLLADHGFDTGLPKNYRSVQLENLLANRRSL